MDNFELFRLITKALSADTIKGMNRADFLSMVAEDQAAMLLEDCNYVSNPFAALLLKQIAWQLLEMDIHGE